MEEQPGRSDEPPVKHIVAGQLEQARRARTLSKTELAALMRTSRSQLERVLDPENGAVSLAMLDRAAAALGKRLRIELDDAS